MAIDDRYIKSTEEELGALQTPQKELTPQTVPTGLVDRGGITYTVDLATGNLVPLGAEFREAETRRRIGEESAERRKLFGMQTEAEFQRAKEEEERTLTSQKSVTEGTRAIETLGFGSASWGAIGMIEDQSRRRIRDLERAKNQANISFNMQELNRVNEEIRQERTAQRERESTLFSRLVALKGLAKEEQTKKIQDIVAANLDALPKEQKVLTLPSGQDISLSDPNIGEYRKVSGAVERTIPGDTNAFYDRLAKQYGIDRNQLEAAFVSAKTEIKPMEVSPGVSLVDPKTGKVLYTAPTTLKPEEKPQSVKEYEYYAKQVLDAKGSPMSFDEYQNADANRKRSIQNTYIQGGLTKEQFNRLNVISDNARQDINIKDFPAVRASFETARGAKESKNSAGDIVLMRMLAKITDPTTGVREEEYRTFENAIGTLPRYGIQLTTGMVGKGQLTDSGREALFNEIDKIYNQRKSAYSNSVEFFTKQAEKTGGSQEDVLPVYLAPQTGVLKSPDGKSQVNISDLTPAQIEEAKQAGWK